MGEVRRIRDQSDWQQHIGSIVEKINADPTLALAAACNPFLALAELGYQLDAAVIADLEERARYSKRQIVERRALRADLAKMLGRSADALTRDSLRAMIGANPESKKSAKDSGPAAVDGKPVRDLAVKLLAIEDGARGFADTQTYAAIREGQRRFPSIKLRARLATERRKPAKGKQDEKGKGRA